MKRVAILAMALASTSSFALTINFDDLFGDNLPVPDGYSGANWSPGSWIYYNFSQPPYNPTSGTCRVYTVGSGRIDFTTDVIVSDAWFNGHGSSQGFLPIHFELYNDGSLVHTSGSIDLDSSGNAMQLFSGYTGAVDRLDVIGSSGWFVMDDLTINPVPEPATMVALGAGLAAVAARRRRK